MYTYSEQDVKTIKSPDTLVDLLRLRLLIYKLHGLFSLDTSDGADFLVIEQDSVKLVAIDKHLWSESGSDELAG